MKLKIFSDRLQCSKHCKSDYRDTKNQTYVSVGAVNARGIIQNNDLDRYNFSVRNTTSMLNDKLTMDLSFMYSNVKEQNMLSQGEYANPLVPVYLFPRGDDFSKYQYYERYDVDRNIKHSSGH